jgi:hypothetical protein
MRSPASWVWRPVPWRPLCSSSNSLDSSGALPGLDTRKHKQTWKAAATDLQTRGVLVVRLPLNVINFVCHHDSETTYLANNNGLRRQ